MSATDAARNFLTILDAVEHRGEHYAIVRRGKVIAKLDPAGTGKGADVKAVLRRHGNEPSFADDVTAARLLVEIETRP